jgi:hypothetical protein|tara:strand:- start:4653 stop:4769 length:117 start_codon:yes stop_codon:yes gene_type:complete
VHFVLGWRLQGVRHEYGIMIEKYPMNMMAIIQAGLRKL